MDVRTLLLQYQRTFLDGCKGMVSWGRRCRKADWVDVLLRVVVLGGNHESILTKAQWLPRNGCHLGVRSLGMKIAMVARMLGLLTWRSCPIGGPVVMGGVILRRMTAQHQIVAM